MDFFCRLCKTNLQILSGDDKNAEKKDASTDSDSKPKDVEEEEEHNKHLKRTPIRPATKFRTGCENNVEDAKIEKCEDNGIAVKDLRKKLKHKISKLKIKRKRGERSKRVREMCKCLNRGERNNNENGVCKCWERRAARIKKEKGRCKSQDSRRMQKTLAHERRARSDEKATKSKSQRRRKRIKLQQEIDKETEKNNIEITQTVVSEEYVVDIMIKVSGLLVSRDYKRAKETLELLLAHEGVNGEIGIKFIIALCDLYSKPPQLVLQTYNDLKQIRKTDSENYPFNHILITQALIILHRYDEAEKMLNEMADLKLMDISFDELDTKVDSESVKQIILEMFDLVQLNLENIMSSLMRQCTYHVAPEAACRYEQCDSHLGRDIFVSHPDCKGFVRVRCKDDCKVDFHPSCWKHKKKLFGNKIHDKDMLTRKCLTPDCNHLIHIIKIFDSAGELKTTIGSDDSASPSSATHLSQEKVIPSTSKLSKTKGQLEIRKTISDTVDDNKDVQIQHEELVSVPDTTVEHTTSTHTTSTHTTSTHTTLTHTTSTDLTLFSTPKLCFSEDLVELAKKEKDDSTLSQIEKESIQCSGKSKKKQRDKKLVDVDINYSDSIKHRSATLAAESGSPTHNPEIPPAVSSSGERQDPGLVPDNYPELWQGEWREEENTLVSAFELVASVLKCKESMSLAEVEDLGRQVANNTLEAMIKTYGSFSAMLTNSSELFTVINDKVILTAAVPRYVPHDGAIKDKQLVNSPKNKSNRGTDKLKNQNSDVETQPVVNVSTGKCSVDKRAKFNSVIANGGSRHQEDISKAKPKSKINSTCNMSTNTENRRQTNKPVSKTKSKTKENNVLSTLPKKPPGLMEAVKLVLKYMACELFSVRTTVCHLKYSKAEAQVVLFKMFEDALLVKYGAVIDENLDFRQELSERNFQIILNFLSQMWREEDKRNREKSELTQLKTSLGQLQVEMKELELRHVEEIERANEKHKAEIMQTKADECKLVEEFSDKLQCIHGLYAAKLENVKDTYLKEIIRLQKRYKKEHKMSLQNIAKYCKVKQEQERTHNLVDNLKILLEEAVSEKDTLVEENLAMRNEILKACKVIGILKDTICNRQKKKIDDAETCGKQLASERVRRVNINETLIEVIKSRTSLLRALHTQPAEFTSSICLGTYTLNVGQGQMRCGVVACQSQSEERNIAGLKPQKLSSGKERNGKKPCSGRRDRYLTPGGSSGGGGSNGGGDGDAGGGDYACKCSSGCGGDAGGSNGGSDGSGRRKSAGGSSDKIVGDRQRGGSGAGAGRSHVLSSISKDGGGKSSGCGNVCSNGKAAVDSESYVDGGSGKTAVASGSNDGGDGGRWQSWQRWIWSWRK